MELTDLVIAFERFNARQAMIATSVLITEVKELIIHSYDVDRIIDNRDGTSTIIRHSGV